MFNNFPPERVRGPCYTFSPPIVSVSICVQKLSKPAGRQPATKVMILSTTAQLRSAAAVSV